MASNCTSQGCTCRCKSCGSSPYPHCNSHGNGCHLSCDSKLQVLCLLIAVLVIAAALVPLWLAAGASS